MHHSTCNCTAVFFKCDLIDTFLVINKLKFNDNDFDTNAYHWKFFQYSSKSKKWIPLSHVENSFHISTLYILTESEHFKELFLQHNYAADIKKIYKKDKLQTVETHIWESDVLGDELRDKFEAGVRDAVIWSELAFTNKSYYVLYIQSVTTQLCCQWVINYYIGYNYMFRPWVQHCCTQGQVCHSLTT